LTKRMCIWRDVRFKNVQRNGLVSVFLRHLEYTLKPLQQADKLLGAQIIGLVS
jgi:hypothetical protein